MPSRLPGPRTCRYCGRDFTALVDYRNVGHKIGTCDSCRSVGRADNVHALPDGVVMPNLPGALCSDRDPELWQTEEPSEYVRGLCADCPARQACLDWAVRFDEMGVWGGLTRRERDRLKARVTA